MNYLDPLAFVEYAFDLPSPVSDISDNSSKLVFKHLNDLYESDLESENKSYKNESDDDYCDLLANEEKIIEKREKISKNESLRRNCLNQESDDEDYSYLLANEEKLVNFKTYSDKENKIKKQSKQKKEIVLIKEFSNKQMQKCPIILINGKNKKERSLIINDLLINQTSTVYFENEVDYVTLRNILELENKSKHSVVFDECFADYDSYDSKTKCAVYELFVTQNETKIPIVITSSSITIYPQFIRQLFDYVILLQENNVSIQKILRNKFGRNHKNFLAIFDQITQSASAMVLQQKNSNQVYYLTK